MTCSNNKAKPCGCMPPESPKDKIPLRGWIFIFTLIILLLILAFSCKKEDMTNDLEFRAYGNGWEWVGYNDGDGWQGGAYRDSIIFKFEVLKGDTMAIYNGGNRSVLIINGETYFDLNHDEPLTKTMIFY